jgi:hypothetical protein
MVETLCPSGQGDGLEIHWALPAGVRIPSVSSQLQRNVAAAAVDGPKMRASQNRPSVQEGLL